MNITVEVKADKLVDAINNLADSLSNNKSEWVSPPAAETEKIETEKTEAPKEEKKEDNPALTLEAVRSFLAALSQSGKQKEVKALISSFGVSKLTDVPKEKYAELLEKAQEIE